MAYPRARRRPLITRTKTGPYKRKKKYDVLPTRVADGTTATPSTFVLAGLPLDILII